MFKEEEPDCGGCISLGSHRRWCSVVVGKHASQLGRLSEHLESIGDQIGSNNPIAANHCYKASTLLVETARMIAL
jgi:hypothetical protein